MELDQKSKAAKGMQALRDRLAKSSHDFAKASESEARMEEFCASVRNTLGMLRRDKGLNQQALALRLNLTQSAISKIELGNGDIGLRTLYRYADAIGLVPVLTFRANEER